MKKFIIVKTQIEGFHCWPEAPTQVMFLRNTHRHLFYITAKMPIETNRQLEFFMVKKAIDKYLRSIYIGASISCEEMAEKIADFIHKEYNIDDIITVQVFEDNENGAEVQI